MNYFMCSNTVEGPLAFLAMNACDHVIEIESFSVFSRFFHCIWRIFVFFVFSEIIVSLQQVMKLQIFPCRYEIIINSIRNCE